LRQSPIGLFAVERVGAKGLTYGQLDRCFRTATGKSCHRAKASAILDALQTLDLIKRTGNYSTGSNGNKYRAVIQPPSAADLAALDNLFTEPPPPSSQS
jgi:hypothetical protein